MPLRPMPVEVPKRRRLTNEEADFLIALAVEFGEDEYNKRIRPIAMKCLRPVE